jgi:uncharacterized protein involved in tolerance to divalent cations
MVNVIIHLNANQNAKELVKFLLTEKLIASASIDENNVSYRFDNEILIENTYSVITAQSKSLLFNDIVKVVEEKIGEETLINSIPIVSSNRTFNEEIKSRTIPI